LFAAIPGTKIDGADFIGAAIANGATAILGETPASCPVPYLHVENARLALARAAAAFDDYPARRLKLIGITGTNGKTTTAFLLRYLLNALGERAAMLGTIEYDTIAQKIPAPLTTPSAPDFVRYLREAVDAGAGYAVAEISSHALALDRVAGCEFSAAAFSNLTRDHLDYHGTLENYAAAKQKLFSGLAPNAVAIVNADDAYGELMTRDCRAEVITYGIENSAAAWNATAIRYAIDGTRFQLSVASRQPPVVTGNWQLATGNSIFLPLVGRHNLYNALAAIATLAALNFAPEKIFATLAGFPGVPGRLERIAKNGREVFIDYAHTPDAIEKVLQTLRPLTRGKLWIVFGCGGDRDRGKRPLMARAAETNSDRVIVTNDNPRTESPAQIFADIRAGFTSAPEFIPDRAAAIKSALTGAGAGDTILIAGKGHEDYQILGADKIHFSDRETVSAIKN
jgi:UDP-N-acetylmuramoyl-L-alanyl-D-glutamate--2,6-diaminopimelate ligase